MYITCSSWHSECSNCTSNYDVLNPSEYQYQMYISFNFFISNWTLLLNSSLLTPCEHLIYNFLCISMFNVSCMFRLCLGSFDARLYAYRTVRVDVTFMCPVCLLLRDVYGMFTFIWMCTDMLMIRLSYCSLFIIVYMVCLWYIYDLCILFLLIFI